MKQKKTFDFSKVFFISEVNPKIAYQREPPPP